LEKKFNQRITKHGQQIILIEKHLTSYVFINGHLQLTLNAAVKKLNILSSETLGVMIPYHGRMSLPFAINTFSRNAKLVYRYSSQA
jgi:hypothetical protein